MIRPITHVCGSNVRVSTEYFCLLKNAFVSCFCVRFSRKLLYLFQSFINNKSYLPKQLTFTPPRVRFSNWMGQTWMTEGLVIMTSLILCLLPSGAVASLGNKRKISDVIMTSRFYHVTSSSSPWVRLFEIQCAFTSKHTIFFSFESMFRLVFMPVLPESSGILQFPQIGFWFVMVIPLS